jgi:hypothetical protein
MEWAFIVSIIRVSGPSNNSSTTNVIEGFKTEALCRQVVQAIKAEMAAVLPGPRGGKPSTWGRVLCVQRQ